MAQKAAKATARRNTQILKTTHLASLVPHTIFILLRILLFRASLTRTSLLLYTLLNAPAWGIQAFFEISGRPTYTAGRENDLKRAGQDLEAPGLTEFMWDVLYWTWGVTALAGLAGDWAWWGWVVVPLYAGYAGWMAVRGFRGALGMGGAAPAAEEVNGSADGKGSASASGSKRQQKMEKRGGQKAVYR